MSTKGLTHWADIVIVVVYFIIVVSAGLWTLCRPNRGNVKSYFLASGAMTWFPVGASLFSSNIGAEHFVGLAGTGAAAGIAIILYEWMPSMLIVALGWFFIPVYISAGVFTLPEYLEKRFGGKRLRTYMSVLSLIMYIITKLATSIFSGAIYIQLALGWDTYLSIVCLLCITAIYTVLGGLTAVIYTDTVQTCIMMAGAFVVVGYSFAAIGGYNNLERTYFEAIPAIRDINSSCGLPREDALHLFRHPLYSDNPWPGLLIQSTLGCVWYWCCDQVIVQRALAAKNLSHAKGASLMAAILKIFPLFIMVFPGMISRALYPDEVGCADAEECTRVCDNPVGCSNIAYPKLVLELLPVGFRGLMMAVMMSAIMGSLTSIFNSASTVFTMDLWRRLRPHATQRELLIVGRIAVVAMCVISVAWLPLVKTSQGGQIFIYLNAIQSFIGTPVGAVFLWAMLWKRCTERAAFWSLVVVHIIGVIRMVLEFVYAAPPCGEVDTRPAVVAMVHYTYFGPLLMVIASIVIVSVSLIFKDTQDNLQGVTWWTRWRGLDTEGEVKEAEHQQNIELEAMEEREQEVKVHLPRLRRWVDSICGMPEREEDSKNAYLDIRRIQMFLFEKPKWKTVLNFVAAGTIIVVAFLCGFYH